MFVLALSVTLTWTVDCIWNWNMFQHRAVHKEAAGLEPKRAMFHCLTECDTVSSFASHQKKTGRHCQSWPKHYWSCHLQPLNYQKRICSPLMSSSDFPSSCMRIVYITSTWANIYKTLKTLKNLFARRNVEWIPPTKAAYVSLFTV
jgi:hypothetical protein